MTSKYKEKIIKEIDDIPEEMIPKIYKLVHLLTKEFIDKKKHTGKRGSLKGIWKGSNIDDKLYNDAKESLFPYESI